MKPWAMPGRPGVFATESLSSSATDSGVRMRLPSRLPLPRIASMKRAMSGAVDAAEPAGMILS